MNFFTTITIMNLTTLLFYVILGRVGMGMMTLLTLTAMFNSTRHSVPKVSYVSYLDIWMVSCMIFVVGSIIEFVVVQHLQNTNRSKIGTLVDQITQILMFFLFLTFSVFYWIVCLYY